MTTTQSPSLQSLEAALAARFPSLRRECAVFYSPHLMVEGADRTWQSPPYTNERHAPLCICHGLGYVPAVTVEGLLEAMREAGYAVVLCTYETLATCGCAFRKGGDEASEFAPTPREAVIRAACAALQLILNGESVSNSGQMETGVSK